MRKGERDGPIVLTRADALRLAAETGADPRTVARVAKTGRTDGAVAQSIRAAAERLGIRLPKRAA
jgi:hypothetical protein